MTEHEILMLVAAPLLVLGRPLFVWLWALPLAWRRTVGDWSKRPWVRYGWQALTLPLVAWSIQAVALWVWHAPLLFQAMLQSELIHTLQHVSFRLSALLFWWAVLHGGRGWMGYGAATLYVFTTSIHSGALGALLTFSSRLWYPTYRVSTAAWGLTPLEDQQLGGLLMWIPAGLVYLFAGLALMAGWLRYTEAGTHQRRGITERTSPLRPVQYGTPASRSVWPFSYVCSLPASETPSGRR